MSSFQPRWAFAVTAAMGAGGWLVLSAISGRREAWDSGLYFTMLLPIIALVVAIVSHRAPERAWRWAFVPFVAQAVVAFIQNPSASLLPLGLLMFGLYGVLCLPAVWIGKALRKERT